MEWFGIAACVGAALTVAIVEPADGRVRGLLIALAVIGAMSFGFFALTDAYRPAPALEHTAQYRPGDARRLSARNEFAGSTSCRPCHPSEFSTWNASFHRKMTEPATLEGIVPDIVDEHFEWQGRSYRIWREGDDIFADTPRFGTDGKGEGNRVVAPVVMTTGSHHMQAYWTPVPDAVTGEHERGRSLFNARCAMCHGKEGRGGNAAKLLGGGYLDDEIRPWVANGVVGHQQDKAPTFGLPAELLRIVPFPKKGTTAATEGAPSSTGVAPSTVADATPDAGTDAVGTIAITTPTSAPAATPPAASSNDVAFNIKPEGLPLEVRLQPDEVEAIVSFLLRIQFDGKLAQFPYVYLVEKKRWVHEEDSFLQPPIEVDTQERAGDRWGYNCDECHSTGASYGYLTEDLTARSDAVDLGIACESCHGPAKAHVERERDPLSRYRRHLGQSDTLASPANAHGVLQPARLPKDRASHVCAQCHADLERTGAGYLKFRPGDDLEKFAKITFVPMEGDTVPKWLAESIEDDEELLSGGFWDDGTVRIAGRDFNGLKQSACYQKGEMSCLSCHSMHKGRSDAQLHPAMDPAVAATTSPHPELNERKSDVACTTCHGDLATDDAIAAHTHHPVESTGSRCVNCHMPYTTYGLLKAIRAHRVDNPTVEMTTEYGRPNACNLCHLDKSIGFVDASLQKWYGRAPADLDDVDRDLAAGPQWALRGDAVVRAITAWHMGWGPARAASARDDNGAWMDHYLAYLLKDPYVAVRLISEHRLVDDVGGAFASLSIPYPADASVQTKAREDGLKRVTTPTAKAVDASLLLTPAGLDVDAIAAHFKARDTEDVRVNE